MPEPIELLPPGTGPHDPAFRVWLGGDLYALVDATDRDLVEPYVWSPARSGDRIVYARAIVGDRRKLLHNHITGWPMCDHVNGDGLDNRRANLRPATRSQNMANRRKGSGASRFKGVYIHAPGRWKAQIRIGGKHTYLGLFDREEDAAMAYDERAREAFGSFAALNFPREGENSCLR